MVALLYIFFVISIIFTVEGFYLIVLAACLVFIIFYNLLEKQDLTKYGSY